MFLHKKVDDHFVLLVWISVLTVLTLLAVYFSYSSMQSLEGSLLRSLGNSKHGITTPVTTQITMPNE